MLSFLLYLLTFLFLLTFHISKCAQIKVIAIIAEGIPENNTRHMNKVAKEKGVVIIGPATVGSIKPGCFKIGNTGGMIDNIIASKLYRPGRCEKLMCDIVVVVGGDCDVCVCVCVSVSV